MSEKWSFHKEVGRGLDHPGHLRFAVQVREKRPVGLQVLVVEVERNVPENTDVAIAAVDRVDGAHGAEADLHVLEQLARGGRLVGHGVDVGARHVGDRTVGPETEVAQAHRLLPVDDQRRQRKEHLAGHVRLGFFLEVVGARMRLLEQALEVRAVHPELVREPLGRQPIDRSDVSGRLERDRGDLRGVRERRQRRDEVTPAERVDHHPGQVLRA